MEISYIESELSIILRVFHGLTATLNGSCQLGQRLSPISFDEKYTREINKLRQHSYFIEDWKFNLTTPTPS